MAYNVIAMLKSLKFHIKGKKGKVPFYCIKILGFLPYYKKHRLHMYKALTRNDIIRNPGLLYEYTILFFQKLNSFH